MNVFSEERIVVILQYEKEQYLLRIVESGNDITNTNTLLKNFFMYIPPSSEELKKTYADIE